MQKGLITLPEFLEIGSNRLIDELESSNYSSFFVLCDENTQQHCWPKLKRWYPQHFNEANLIAVSAGEDHKNLRSAEFIWNSLVNAGADRHSVLINLGGGMITDLGSFSASLFQRGIDFIQIPTTLLAIVDAAIGGKTAVDLENLKNQIGSFSQPRAIYVFTDFLETLSDDEYLGGMAEIYKHALINDKGLWSELTNHSSFKLDQGLIQRASKIKSDIVGQDPMEKSIRKILNFGHTIGHAIESNFLSYNNPISHGFAVAAGMICEAFISKSTNGLSEEDFQNVSMQLKASFPKLEWTEGDELDMIGMMQKDKKNRAGQIKMVLMDSIGHASFDHDVSEAMILSALKFYREEC